MKKKVVFPFEMLALKRLYVQNAGMIEKIYALFPVTKKESRGKSKIKSIPLKKAIPSILFFAKVAIMSVTNGAVKPY